jgi:hypothetical protein
MQPATTNVDRLAFLAILVGVLVIVAITALLAVGAVSFGQAVTWGPPGLFLAVGGSAAWLMRGARPVP